MFHFQFVPSSRLRPFLVKVSQRFTNFKIFSMIDNQTVSIVKHAKLLVIVSNDLKWNLHVNAICKKASKCLYALRLLGRNALPDSVLVKVYCTCVRPILEYACEVWHNNLLPVYLSNQVEQIQKRALRIIFSSLSYDQAMLIANLPSLHDRRSTLCNRLFHHMLDPSHKLNSLVPPRRVNECN